MQVTHFLLDQADRISKSATADNVVDDCSHIYNISELMPSSPVNAVNNVIDPNCDCNVELELSVPAEPVSVSRQNDSGDVETDLIVQRLSQLPIQMRTSNSLLDDIRYFFLIITTGSSLTLAKMLRNVNNRQKCTKKKISTIIK